MIKRNLIFLILTFILKNYTMYAQSDFRAGFIITNDNDTLNGFIDYRNDYLNCNKCVFKEKIENDALTFLPGEINSYRFLNSKYYISTYVSELEKFVFLEYLIDGIVDIYYYQDIFNEIHYFVKRDGSSLDELKIVREVFEYKVRTSKDYIIELRKVFKDDKETLKKLNKVGFNHKSFINIANEYHQNVCSDKECIVFEKKLLPVRFEVSALVFSDLYTIELEDRYATIDYNMNINYSVGFGISTYLPRLNERISIYYQLLYCSNSFNSSVVVIDGYHNLNIYSYNKMDYLNNNLGFKYTFPKGKVRPEFIIAWANNYVLFSNAKRIIEDEYPKGIVNTYNHNYIFNGSYNGFAIGGGLNFFNFKDIDVNVNLHYNYIGGSGISQNILRFGLGIKY